MLGAGGPGGGGGASSASKKNGAPSSFAQVAIPHESHYILKLLYLIVTTTAMCLEVSLAVMEPR